MKKFDEDHAAAATNLLTEIEERDSDDDEQDDALQLKLLHILNYKTYDHLIYMAVITIFLCFPLGVVALLFALKAHNDAIAGNYEKAKRESWTVWAIVSLAALIDLLIVVIVLVVKTT